MRARRAQARLCGRDARAPGTQAYPPQAAKAEIQRLAYAVRADRARHVNER